MLIRILAFTTMLSSSLAMADGPLDMNNCAGGGKMDCLIHGLQQLKRLGCELGEDAETNCAVRIGLNVMTKNCDFPVTYQDPAAAKNGAAERDCKTRGRTYVPNDVTDPVFPGICKRSIPGKTKPAAKKSSNGSVS